MAIEATPARAAQSRPCATPRRSGRLRIGLSSRVAVLLVAVFAALSFGPASGGLARRERRQVRRAGAHARDRRPGARAARPLGLRLVPHDRRLGLRRQHRRGPPSSRSTRCSCAAWARSFGGSHAALLVAAFLVSLGGVRRGAGAPVPAHRARAGPPARAPDAAAARRVPGGGLLRRALLGEPVPAAGGGRVLRGAHGALGVGGRLRRRSRRPPAARALLLVLPLRDDLVGLAAAARRATRAWLLLAPLGHRRATPPGSGSREGDALRFLDVQEAWSRAPRGAAGRRLGRARAPRSTACASSRRARARRSTSTRRRGDPFRIAAINVMLFATLVFAVVACVGVFRRLPRAYGVWVAASLAAAADLPGHAAAADVAAALRRRAVPDLHVARARVRGAAGHRPRGGRRRPSGSACSPPQYASWHWIS